MKITLKPTLDRVAILPDPKEEKTKGGIVIPGQAQKEVNYGTVLAVGPGGFNADGTRRPMGVKPKDRVFFSDCHLTETGSKAVIVDEEDILAVAGE